MAKPIKLIVTLLFISTISTVHAQSSVVQGMLEQQRQSGMAVERSSVPEIKEKKAAKLAESKAQKAHDKIKIQVGKIVLQGQNLPNLSKVSAMTKSYQDKTVSFSQLEDLGQSIEALYRKAGYQLATVVLPPQKMAKKAAEVKFDVHLAKLGQVIVQGLDQAKKVLAPYVAILNLNTYVKVASVESVLLAMRQVPGLQVSSTFVPSKTKLGATDLIIKAEVKRLFVSVFSTNYTQEALGDNTTQLTLGVNGLLGRDSLSINGGKSIPFQYLTNYGANYTKLFGSYNTELSLGYAYTKSDPDDSTADLEFLNIKSHSTRYSVGLSQPIWLERGSRMNIYANAYHSDLRNDSDVQSQPFSHTVLTALTLGLSGSKTFLGGNHAYGLSATKGFNLLGAKAEGTEEIKKDFLKYNIYLSRYQPLFRGLDLTLSSQGQFSNDNMATSEQLWYGGSNYGGGFRGSILAGNTALQGKATLGYSRLPMILKSRIKPYVFYDYGHGKTKFNGSDVSASASSVGAGLSVAMGEHLSMNLIGAKPLTVPTSVDPDFNKSWRFFYSVSANF